jgi:hypothetical protein
MASTGIFPTDTAGGLVIRDDAGAPTNPVGVENAYVPAPGYVSDCDLTALPSDCTARIEPRQINAIVSELLSFAEYLDPDGPWNCASYTNMRSAFDVWVAGHIKIPVIISDTPPADPDLNQLWWESDTGILWIWYDDGTESQWVAIAPATPRAAEGTLTTVSNRQFYQQLALSGLITREEALNAVKGTIPPAFDAALGKTNATSDERFNAQMFLSSATTFPREHPVVKQLATAMNWSEDVVDQIWQYARKL